MIQHLLHRCERCKQPRLDNGAPCSLCQSVAVESYAPAKIRPFRTYKNGMRAFYEPKGPKPAKVRADTSERARQDVLAVLRAIEGGERSISEIRAATGLGTIHLGSALATAWLDELAEKRIEQHSALERTVHYSITEAGRERLIHAAAKA